MCEIDLFSKYEWVVPLKGKRGITIINAFQKIILKGRKLNQIWVDQGSEFYNKIFKIFLKLNNIEMYSTYNEGKSVVAERFIRTLKNKIFKHMTAISKNVYFDVLDDRWCQRYYQDVLFLWLNYLYDLWIEYTS